jgi:hypothetical protein
MSNHQGMNAGGMFDRQNDADVTSNVTECSTMATQLSYRQLSLCSIKLSSSRLHSPKYQRDTLSARASAFLDSKPIEQKSSTVSKRTAAGSVDQSVPFLHALSECAVSCMAAVAWQSECTG